MRTITLSEFEAEGIQKLCNTIHKHIPAQKRSIGYQWGYRMEHALELLDKKISEASPEPQPEPQEESGQKQMGPVGVPVELDAKQVETLRLVVTKLESLGPGIFREVFAEKAGPLAVELASIRRQIGSWIHAFTSIDLLFNHEAAKIQVILNKEVIEDLYNRVICMSLVYRTKLFPDISTEVMKVLAKIVTLAEQNILQTPPTTFRSLQEKQKEWEQKNFDNVKHYHSFLGVVEEVGELAHSMLKKEQGIRGNDHHHDENIKDAIGDIAIFLASYCNNNDYDLDECIRDAWEEVSARDWKKNPNGG